MPARLPQTNPRSVSRRRRWVRRGLFTFSVLVGLYAGLVVSVAYLALHPPHRLFPVLRADTLKHEEFSFHSLSSDHLSLKGWYLPAADLHHVRGLVVYCHGRDGNRSAVLHHAAFLHRAGFALVSFDFRGYGDADGMSTIGWREVGDARGALAWVRSRSDLKRLPLGMFGQSMGAAVAIQTAALEPTVEGVVADSSYASLDHAVAQRFRGVLGPPAVVLSVPVQWVGEQMMGTQASAVSPLKAIPKIAPRPVFLIHGTADQLIPPEDSRELYAAAGEPKTLWMVPGAAHVRSDRVARKEYEARVTAFFMRFLSPPRSLAREGGGG